LNGGDKRFASQCRALISFCRQVTKFRSQRFGTLSERCSFGGRHADYLIDQ
jgi:hypothetical protein